MPYFRTFCPSCFMQLERCFWIIMLLSHESPKSMTLGMPLSTEILFSAFGWTPYLAKLWSITHLVDKFKFLQNKSNGIKTRTCISTVFMLPATPIIFSLPMLSTKKCQVDGKCDEYPTDNKDAVLLNVPPEFYNDSGIGKTNA